MSSFGAGKENNSLDQEISRTLRALADLLVPSLSRKPERNQSPRPLGVYFSEPSGVHLSEPLAEAQISALCSNIPAFSLRTCQVSSLESRRLVGYCRRFAFMDLSQKSNNVKNAWRRKKALFVKKELFKKRHDLTHFGRSRYRSRAKGARIHVLKGKHVWLSVALRDFIFKVVNCVRVTC